MSFSKNIYRKMLVMLLFSVAMGCGQPPEVFSGAIELVMSPGMVIEVSNANGTMQVEAIGKIRRGYTWGGATRKLSD